jgi:hypothetical protein
VKKNGCVNLTWIGNFGREVLEKMSTKGELVKLRIEDALRARVRETRAEIREVENQIEGLSPRQRVGQAGRSLRQQKYSLIRRLQNAEHRLFEMRQRVLPGLEQQPRRERYN